MKHKIQTILIVVAVVFGFGSLKAQEDPGNALEFDGIDDNVVINTVPTLSNSFTFSAWIKPDALSGSQQILSAGSTTTPYNTIQFRTDGDKLEFGISNGTPTLTKITGTESIILNRWNHIAVVKSNTSIKLFLNGFEVGTGTIATSTTFDQMHIGALIDVVHNTMFFDGQIDEVRIWNTAKDLAEIRANMYLPLTSSETNLLAYYNFDTTSGTTLADQTTNSYDGTLQNMAGSEWTESYALVAPEPQAATNINANDFTANWLTQTSGQADGYYLDVSKDSDFSTFVVQNQDVTANSFNVTGMESATTYYYRVRAYKNSVGDVGAWHYSNPISLTTPFDNTDMDAPGNAIYFDGTDDNISFQNIPTLGDNFTISAWILPENMTAAHQIVSFGSTTEAYHTVQLRLDGDKLEFGMSAGTPALQKVTAGNIALNPDRWNQVAVSKNGSDITLFVNGYEAGSGTINVTGLNINQMHFGALIDVVHNVMYYKGLIDEVRIWDEAKSLTQIREKMYVELAGNEANLLAYYDFNATQGNTIEDKSTNDYTGILNNMNNPWQESYALVCPAPLDATNIAENSFTANWEYPITGIANGYLLDVSLSEDFSSYVLEALDISPETNVEVNNLEPETQYFYRVRSYKTNLGDVGAWHYENPKSLTTLEATEQAHSIVVSNITTSSAQLDWTRGTGDFCALFILQGTDGTASPVDANAYNDDTEFGLGDEAGTGWYCIYNGTGTNVTVTGLNELTDYRAMVLEYKDDNTSNQKYLTNAMNDNPVNFKTLETPPEEVVIQNFISPNNDGVNDYWEVEGLQSVEEYKINILNNLGEIIYETDTYNNDWDMQYNGQDLPSGTYYYIITYDEITLKGTITLIR